MAGMAPGEKEVVAAVVATDPARFDAQAVFEACRAKLDANSVPRFVQLVDEIPKTASEKPQERFLLQAFDVGGRECPHRNPTMKNDQRHWRPRP